MARIIADRAPCTRLEVLPPQQHGVSVMEAVLVAQKEEARSRLSKADLPADLREVLLWLVERA